MKQEKQNLLNEIKQQVLDSKAFVIAQYEKLSAVKANEFRRELQKSSAHFEVVRKRMFLRALGEVDASKDTSELSGHIGIIFIGADPVEATKTVIKFSKDNENALKPLGGCFDGKMVSADDVKMIATLPSLDQMRSELLGLFDAPAAQTLSVFEALLTSLAYCLENKAQEG